MSPFMVHLYLYTLSTETIFQFFLSSLALFSLDAKVNQSKCNSYRASLVYIHTALVHLWLRKAPRATLYNLPTDCAKENIIALR